MPISENLLFFAGRKVLDWEEGTPITDTTAAYRIRTDYEGPSWTDKFAAFLEDPKVGEIQAFVVGCWVEAMTGESSLPIVESLTVARDKLRSLNALFFGDITFEECEISWINQSDLSPLLEAYPNLEHLTIRGGQSLSLGTPRLSKLRELVIQAGGLPPSVIHEVGSAELPVLEHLELWLGDPGYGGDVTIEDLAPLLKAERFPRLKYLGIKNSSIQDEVAGVLALAPVTSRLEVLDLSMGTLGDEGAKALLASPAIKHLKRLDIHHHYISEDLVKQLEQLGIEIDASDPQGDTDEDDRFVSVSE